jgi:spore coat protein U-like protein
VTRTLIAFLLFVVPALACAQTACTFSSTPGVAFGMYDDSSAAPTDTATSVVASCARNGGPANVSMTLQIGPSATSGQVATRQMRSGTSLMNYNLYRDAGRTAVWGQTSGVDTMTIAVNGIPNNGARSETFVIYGRISALQNVAAGAYSDSATLTVMP